MSITKDLISEGWFKTKEDVIEFYSIRVRNAKNDINSLETTEKYNTLTRNYFAQELLTVSINNNPIQELMEKFKSDILNTLKGQLSEYEEGLNEAKNLEEF